MLAAQNEDIGEKRSECTRLQQEIVSLQNSVVAHEAGLQQLQVQMQRYEHDTHQLRMEAEHQQLLCQQIANQKEEVSDTFMSHRHIRLLLLCTLVGRLQPFSHAPHVGSFCVTVDR